VSASDLQLPLNQSPQGLYAWAQRMVNWLRRNEVRITERITTVETVTTEVTTDTDQSLDALAAYADDVQAAIVAANGYAQEVFDDYQTAATARHAKLAQSYLTQAANMVEQTVRVSADEVLSQQITTVSATLATTAASLTNEVTARVNGDTALASQISTVQTQANGNSAAVTQLTSSVDGIKARWGVSIDLNGQVVGLIQLDGAASGSNFTVVADRFIVSMPGFAGTLMTPFIVGSVNGVSTVGINGNLVVDGSIVARHIAAGSIDASRINVSSLSAITANVGTVTAGVIRSASGRMVFDLNNETFTITS
jgi:hypothetical protein